MLRISLPFAAVLLFLLPGTSHGQASRGGFRMPEIGSTLPVVTVYDEHGAEYSTKNLRGQYSVLVFGCLT